VVGTPTVSLKSQETAGAIAPAPNVQV